MANTFDICCPEMKLKMLVGQSGTVSEFYLYSDEPETMKHLSEFLLLTKGKPLIFVDMYCEDDEIMDCEYYRGVK